MLEIEQTKEDNAAEAKAALKVQQKKDATKMLDDLPTGPPSSIPDPPQSIDIMPSTLPGTDPMPVVAVGEDLSDSITSLEEAPEAPEPVI